MLDLTRIHPRSASLSRRHFNAAMACLLDAQFVPGAEAVPGLTLSALTNAMAWAQRALDEAAAIMVEGPAVETAMHRAEVRIAALEQRVRDLEVLTSLDTVGEVTP